MLQKGAEELEKKIANFTTILMQLKTAAITIWVALIGWVFANKINALVPLGYVIIFGFWFLEATYWRVQFYLLRGFGEAIRPTPYLYPGLPWDTGTSPVKFTGLDVPKLNI
ncbi:hypothetical protein [Tychonema sp. LEGE 07203]|uniref:hypothetical protein n=1 Tax=Tychonema sp. LEGE 07203 TaxID=1828671 RepID=UPI00187F991A|nr:hypothetical protein [Tychonema sp. LEGE 07203]MBE9092458.1 hypothetical protein [Tychonema sp. LEGE 07203]